MNEKYKKNKLNAMRKNNRDTKSLDVLNKTYLKKQSPKSNKWIRRFKELGKLTVFALLADEMKINNWVLSESGFTESEIELVKIVGDQVHIHLTHTNCIRYPISDFMNHQGITFNRSEVLVIINYLRSLESQSDRNKVILETLYNKLTNETDPVIRNDIYWKIQALKIESNLF